MTSHCPSYAYLKKSKLQRMLTEFNEHVLKHWCQMSKTRSCLWQNSHSIRESDPPTPILETLSRVISEVWKCTMGAQSRKTTSSAWGKKWKRVTEVTFEPGLKGPKYCDRKFSGKGALSVKSYLCMNTWCLEGAYLQRETFHMGALRTDSFIPVF